MAAKKTLIGYQATEEELVCLDEHWKTLGLESRSVFLRQLVERELNGQSPAPPPQSAPTPASTPAPEPHPDIRQELAALGYVLLSCLRKCDSSEAAKGLIQQFYLSGEALKQIEQEN